MKSVGGINHEYGGLLVKGCNGLFFWSIEANTFDKWEDIPEALYNELVLFEENRGEIT